MTETEEVVNVGYQVLVCNITWNTKNSNGAKKAKSDLPAQLSFDIPEQVLNQANKSKNSFNDIIEQFIYNVLTRKYGYEVNHCQIWLPLDK